MAAVWDEDADYALALHLQEQEELYSQRFQPDVDEEERNESKEQTEAFEDSEQAYKPYMYNSQGSNGTEEMSSPLDGLTLETRSAQDLTLLVDPSVILPENDPDCFIVSDSECEALNKPAGEHNLKRSRSYIASDPMQEYEAELDYTSMKNTPKRSRINSSNRVGIFQNGASTSSNRKSNGNTWRSNQESWGTHSWAPNPSQECPICLKIIGAQNMNDHLDACLEFRSG